MTDGRKQLRLLGVAMALAGEIRIDVALAGTSPRRQRRQFASREQLPTELVACTP